MKIVVASKNPIKVSAARNAVCGQFPQSTLQLVAIAVDSGVNAQPMSDEETRRGARNRADEAGRQHAQADFWIGMEGGLEKIGDRLMAFAWIAVRDYRGRINEARSATLPLPECVVELIEAGMELGDANDKIFDTTDSKSQGGAYGLLTNGLYTRESIYYQTLVIAMVPFINPLFLDYEKIS
jgi:inosine/xanthosine triphosphatase